MSDNEQTLRQRIFAAVDNLAAHTATEKWLAQLGVATIAPLSAYLDQPPAPIPQARCFAVAMLARLRDETATRALRRHLYAHPLATLEPVPAQAEFVVKNDLVAALAERHYPELERDLGFALDHERLPAAARAVGRLRMTALGSTLATLLEDDTLAVPAAQALLALGEPGRQSLLAALQVHLEAPHADVRNRRALIRVLLALGHVPQAPDMAWLAAALRYPHAQVRAAAARLAWRARPRPGLRRALLHGALGNDLELADACRTALQTCDWPERAALCCLRRGWEPDVYGDRSGLTPEAYAWLFRNSLRSGSALSDFVGRISDEPGSALEHALAVGALHEFASMEYLSRHSHGGLHLRVIAALPQCGDPRALHLAITAHASHAARLRRAARHALRHWPHPAQALRETLRTWPRQRRLWRPILEILLLGIWRR